MDKGDETDGETDDFLTMKESDMGDEEQMMFDDGHVLDSNVQIESDASCSLSLVH